MTPIRFTPRIQFQSSSVPLQPGIVSVTTPALLQTTCTAPYLASVCSAKASTCFGRATSVTTACTSAPAARRAWVVSSRGFSSTSASTTFMPASAKASHMPRPIPLAAPVTTATFPLTSFMFFSWVFARARVRKDGPFTGCRENGSRTDAASWPHLTRKTPHAKYVSDHDRDAQECRRDRRGVFARALVLAVEEIFQFLRELAGLAGLLGSLEGVHRGAIVLSERIEQRRRRGRIIEGIRVFDEGDVLPWHAGGAKALDHVALDPPGHRTDEALGRRR